MSSGLRGRLTGAVLAVAVLVGPPAGAQPIDGLTPVEPQPTAAQLEPGLAVQYTYGIMNHIEELKGRRFESGPPLPVLDHKAGEGTVLTSKARDAVGAVITGLIHFDRPGIWGFNVTSNDGVRVEIGGKLLYEDPFVHSDDTSDRIDVKIERPGWHAVTVHYFEKRYTSTLVLRWVGPGEKGKPAPVPAKAFGHIKK
ncbi:MAG: PA14 domain-containing protein [Candidatus Rokuibacteriota bacterium]